MENVFAFEGGSVNYRLFCTSADPKDELITSLTSFARLHSRRRDRLQATSESFTPTAAEKKTARGLFAVLGGALGAASGGVSGGVCGALGAVGAATWGRFCGDVNAVGATVGFVGSVFGGVAGGVFGGAVGSAVGAAAEVTGSPVHGVVSDVTWFTIGFATGGAIGGIFGGTVGSAGGAIGGALGALCATRFTVSLVGGAVGCFCGTKDSKEHKMKMTMQKIVDFRKDVNPLVEELKKIKTIGEKMASDVVHSVTGRTAKTLASVTTMEKMISESQRATDPPQFVSCVEAAARQSKKVIEELETTRAEVEKLLLRPPYWS